MSLLGPGTAADAEEEEDDDDDSMIRCHVVANSVSVSKYVRSI